MNYYQAIIGSIFAFFLIIMVYIYEQDKNDQRNIRELIKKSIDRSVQKCKNCEIIRKERIVGGKIADPGQYPWLVALIYASSEELFCGGSIVSNRFILFALIFHNLLRILI